MQTYHPGQGLSKEAVERLRARKHVEGAAFYMPAADESQQRERLLGGQAKKKPRCAVCTRPLSNQELAADRLLCVRCVFASEPEAEPSERRLKNLSAATPSTDAASEDSDGVRDVTCRVPAVALSGQTPRQVMLQVAKSILTVGEWVSDEGERCRVRFPKEVAGVCLLGSGTSPKAFSLSCDSRSDAIWWGIHKTYWMSISELCDNQDEIVWYRSGAGFRAKAAFVWCRQRAARQNGSRSQGQGAELEVRRGTSASHDSIGEEASAGSWPQASKEAAIKEIEDQLNHPEHDGSVRIPRWNQRFRHSLGTLRQFLESCPERFVVIPGEGRKYSVAAPTASSDANGTGSLSSEWNIAASGHASQHRCEASAVQELERQLSQPRSQGFVWVNNWNQRYLRHLGTLRGFLESRPDKFKVIPQSGKSYRVALVDCGMARAPC